MPTAKKNCRQHGQTSSLHQDVQKSQGRWPLPSVNGEVSSTLRSEARHQIQPRVEFSLLMTATAKQRASIFSENISDRHVNVKVMCLYYKQSIMSEVTVYS